MSSTVIKAGAIKVLPLTPVGTPLGSPSATPKNRVIKSNSTIRQVSQAPLHEASSVVLDELQGLETATFAIQTENIAPKHVIFSLLFSDDTTVSHSLLSLDDNGFTVKLVNETEVPCHAKLIYTAIF